LIIVGGVLLLITHFILSFIVLIIEEHLFLLAHLTGFIKVIMLLAGDLIISYYVFELLITYPAVSCCCCSAATSNINISGARTNKSIIIELN